jgi:hypothetical protein
MRLTIILHTNKASILAGAIFHAKSYLTPMMRSESYLSRRRRLRPVEDSQTKSTYQNHTLHGTRRYFLHEKAKGIWLESDESHGFDGEEASKLMVF